MNKKGKEYPTYCQMNYMGGPKLSAAESNCVGVLSARPQFVRHSEALFARGVNMRRRIPVQWNAH